MSFIHGVILSIVCLSGDISALPVFATVDGSHDPDSPVHIRPLVSTSRRLDHAAASALSVFTGRECLDVLHVLDPHRSETRC